MSAERLVALVFRGPDLDGQRFDGGACRPRKFSTTTQRVGFSRIPLLSEFFDDSNSSFSVQNRFLQYSLLGTTASFLSMGTSVPFRGTWGLVAVRLQIPGLTPLFSQAPRLSLTQKKQKKKASGGSPGIELATGGLWRLDSHCGVLFDSWILCNIIQHSIASEERMEKCKFELRGRHDSRETLDLDSYSHVHSFQSLKCMRTAMVACTTPGQQMRVTRFVAFSNHLLLLDSRHPVVPTWEGCTVRH